MEKTNKKHLKALVILLLVCSTGFAQAKGGMENYNLLGKEHTYAWMPVVHYETKKGIYAELRYNYEEAQTFSVFGGKVLSMNSGSFSVTPMIGLSTGKFTGVSLAANAEAEFNKLFLSTETQYCMNAKKDGNNFLFSWSEIGYSIFPNLFAGFSFQYTIQQGAADPEPGLMAGLSFKNFSIPVYVFNPFGKRQYLVFGLNYEYHLKK